MNEVYKDTTQRPITHPDTKPANIDTSELVQRLGKGPLIYFLSIESNRPMFQQQCLGERTSIDLSLLLIFLFLK